MAPAKRDTYGNAIDATKLAEWQTFQQRNADIEQAATQLRARAEKGTYSPVHFYSEGIKLAGSVWQPKSPLPGRPALLLCHGWGGLCAFLDVRYASKFCQEGFFVMTFDYRTWGQSDGVLVAEEDSSDALQRQARMEDFKTQRPVIGQVGKVRVLRQIVDMHWQLADIDAAISFFTSNYKIGKLGLWGTSLGGGHVLEQAAREDALLRRVSAVVAQVPSVGRNGAGDVPQRRAELVLQNSKAATFGWFPRGASEYHLPAMDGSPLLRTLDQMDPLLSAHNIRHSALLVIDSDREELWDVNRNGARAFALATTKHKEYYLLKNADHYDAYNKAAREARTAAGDFFRKHLVEAAEAKL